MLWSETKKKNIILMNGKITQLVLNRSIPFNGGHFFINENMDEIKKVIDDTLLIKSGIGVNPSNFKKQLLVHAIFNF